MKTLKKTLCLVLAVVMVVGALVLPASAATAYNDDEKITDTFEDAVKDLTDWKVMKGDEQGNFKPADLIERQEMAAIAYRLLTGDVTVDAKTGKDNSGKYASYAAKFTDVPATGWAAGYIGFCVANGIVLGSSDTTFEPARKINATDVLTILLRCMGCTNAFTGADYAQAVSKLATRLGLTAGITQDLGKESPREQVAQMTYNAAKASRVTWSESEQDYIPYTDPNKPGSTANIPLISVGTDAGATYAADKWGVYKGTASTKTVTFTYPVPNVNLTGVPGTAAKTSYYDFWEATDECTIATKADIDEKETLIPVYENGYKTDKVEDINPVDQVDKIGDQGRHTYLTFNPSKTADGYRIVHVDTYLAEVVDVQEEVPDTNSHVIVPASATLEIRDGSQGSRVTATGYIDNSAGTYKKGDMLLVNVLLTDKAEAGKLADEGKYYDAKMAAFEDDDDITEKLFVVDKATKQTVTVSGILGGVNTSRLTGIKDSNNTLYYYNNTFAGRVIGDQYIDEKLDLYLDTEGNIMASELVADEATYGVVTDAELVRVGTNKYAVEYEIFTADKTTQTVRALNATANGYTYYGPAGSPAYDKGDLVRFFPNSAYTGYYVVNPTLSAAVGRTISAADADMLNRNLAVNEPVKPIVNDDTVFFIARYVLNNKSNTYNFTGYDVVKGFKNIAVLANDGTVDGDSVALQVMYFDADGENTKVGYDAEYVVINNATQVTTVADRAVYNYAYITNAKDYKTTESNQYVFEAFINGEKTTLTVAANVSTDVAVPGLYTYSNDKVNGAYTAIRIVGTYGSSSGVITEVTGMQFNGYVTEARPALDVTYDAGVIRYGGTCYSVASDAKVWLVDEEGGKLTPVTLSLVNNYKYTDCEMFCELDKAGNISALYIVDKGIDKTTKPDDPTTYTVTVTVADGMKQTIGLPDGKDFKKDKLTATSDAFTLEITAPDNRTVYWTMSVADGATVTIQKKAGIGGTADNTYVLTISKVTADVTITLDLLPDADATSGVIELPAPAKGKSVTIPEGAKVTITPDKDGKILGTINVAKGAVATIDKNVDMSTGALNIEKGGELKVTAASGTVKLPAIPKDAKVTIGDLTSTTAIGSDIVIKSIATGADVSTTTHSLKKITVGANGANESIHVVAGAGAIDGTDDIKDNTIFDLAGNLINIEEGASSIATRHEFCVKFNLATKPTNGIILVLSKDGKYVFEKATSIDAGKHVWMICPANLNDGTHSQFYEGANPNSTTAPTGNKLDAGVWKVELINLKADGTLDGGAFFTGYFTVD